MNELLSSYSVACECRNIYWDLPETTVFKSYALKHGHLLIMYCCLLWSGLSVQCSAQYQKLPSSAAFRILFNGGKNWNSDIMRGANLYSIP